MTVPAPGNHGSVLLVDDTPSKRYVLASWLRRGGYEVVEAGTGNAALERYAEGGVALVILDVRLPDLTGFEVCERIKSSPGAEGVVPVIHVSAAAVHAEDRTQGLERGADAYLVEPIDPDELLATIASVLRYYQARRDAELLAGRLTRLAEVTAAMSAARTEAELLDAAVRGAAVMFAGPVAIIAAKGDGTRVAVALAGPDRTVTVQPWTGFDDAPLGVALRAVSPDAMPPAGWRAGVALKAMTTRPRRDQPAVVIVVPDEVVAHGAPVLTLLGQAIALALYVLRSYNEEHILALTLQRSLLPRTTPQVAGLQIAVRYLPASDRAEIGGDFYEVARFNEELMVAVGDVGGHSLQAATIMAELRHATRAYLAEGHRPAAVLERLNRMMWQLIPGEIATLCLLALDPTNGRVRMANAGHPPPLIHGPHGVRRIEEHSWLLGLQTWSGSEIEFTFAVGETLVLYTDGLVESRTESFDCGVDRLAAAAATVDADLEHFASRLLEEAHRGDHEDDVAMVVIRRVPS